MVTYAVGHSLVFNVEQLLAIQRVFTKNGDSFLDVLRLTNDENIKLLFNLRHYNLVHTSLGRAMHAKAYS